MMRMLRQRLEPATVEVCRGLGWSSDALEAGLRLWRRAG
jgi:hypothetical protein